MHLVEPVHDHALAGINALDRFFLPCAHLFRPSPLSPPRPRPPHAATQGNFCGGVVSGGVAVPSIFDHKDPGKCIEFSKLQAVRTFALILVILSGLGTLAIAGTDGSKGSKGFAAAAQFFAGALVGLPFCV